MVSNFLEISVESAKNLPNVRRVNMETKAFVKVSISGHPNTKQKTAVDKTHGSNPIWKWPMKFTINDDMLLTLHFQIYCKCLVGKRLIGEVYVPVKELFDRLTDLECQRDVITSSGEAHGVLTFKYVVRKGPMPPPENGHQHGKIREVLSTIFRRIVAPLRHGRILEVLSTIFGRIFVPAGATATATVVADAVTEDS